MSAAHGKLAKVGALECAKNAEPRRKRVENHPRLGLSRRLGGVCRWADWIELDEPLTTEAWISAFQEAWVEVDRLGPQLGRSPIGDQQ